MFADILLLITSYGPLFAAMNALGLRAESSERRSLAVSKWQMSTSRCRQVVNSANMGLTVMVLNAIVRLLLEHKASSFIPNDGVENENNA